MHTVSNDSLFLLIRSLTKSEKRYFKLFSSGMQQRKDKQLIRLFDLVERSRTPDREKILSKGKGINPRQLHNLKAQLQKQVLKSLVLFHSGASIDLQLRERIDLATVLYNKGLYRQCLRTLDLAKRSARANDRPLALLDIIDLEKVALGHTTGEYNDKRVNRIIAETKAVSSSIQNINLFSNLLVKVNSFYVKLGFVRNRDDFNAVRTFFHRNLPGHDEKKLSFREKIFLYSSCVSYYFFIQDFKKGHGYARKWMEAFRERPAMIAAEFEMYIKGLNCLLSAQHKLFLFREFEETYKELMRAHSIRGVHLTENIQMLLFRYKYLHKINHYFMMGDFTGGTKIISVVESELDRFALRLDKHHVLLLYYKVACLYFGAGNFKKAIAWLNRIINSLDVDLREDILSFARILNLVSHYELGNLQLVEHHIRATYRFLLKKEERFLYHRYILRFLKNLSQDIRGEKLIREFSKLKRDLLPLEHHRYEKRPFLYFDIISWLESKIHGVPVERVIKEKAEKKIR